MECGRGTWSVTCGHSVEFKLNWYRKFQNSEILLYQKIRVKLLSS